jgi:hypothetical protein
MNVAAAQAEEAREGVRQRPPELCALLDATTTVHESVR